ncbi:uncharacterized protein K452DRAFT_278036 [Aplosporella prunicola CBS 121167]|uniref:N-acetyltransferase domain-containing protein n=1 Tax=Aplosporella prunicola CBS 121167 TaxID=1176127 RepID=A0A6A6B284_9PEZI|nr:uncharacterized protein K452DRAFT_278036 [Aplosporella prunicola CBS 121167]KAF2137926.1 hypothetical protein K452DRAFT_278036 [Aplosporella prunicola CBS 121167]
MRASDGTAATLKVNAPPSSVAIVPARTPDAIASTRSLFLEYTAWLNIDLSFQSFEDELAGLPGKYSPEKGGEILLAVLERGTQQRTTVRESPSTTSVDGASAGLGGSSSGSYRVCSSGPAAPMGAGDGNDEPLDVETVGCIALRDITPASSTSVSHRRIAEVKRLYVRPAGRGSGVGKKLVKGILDTARQLGYAEVLLDTLPNMEGAIKLYTQSGFVETQKYYDTTLEETIFMRCVLEEELSDATGADGGGRQ